MFVKIIGRISIGMIDTGCKVIVDDGTITNVNMDYIANWAKHGVVVNALVDNGNIVINDYNNLPIFIMDSVDGHGFDSKNKAVIYAQIEENGVVIGYGVQLPNGQLKKYSKQSVIDLISKGVKFANKLKVYNGNIRFNEPMFSMTMNGVGIPYTKKMKANANKMNANANKMNANANNGKVIDKKAQYMSNFDIKDGKLLKVRDGALENGVLKIPEGVIEIGTDAVYDLDINVLILPESLRKLGSVADNVFNYYKLKLVKALARFIDTFYNPKLEYFSDFIVESDGCYFFKEDYKKAEYLLSREIDRNPQRVKNWCNEAGADFDYSVYNKIEVYDENTVIEYLLLEYYQEVKSLDIYRKAQDLDIFKFEVI